MAPSFDVLIGGAGLAGASSARALARAGYRVLLVDRHTVASGASGSGSGMVNPMMSRKGRPVWQVREALQQLNPPPGGLLRPARTQEQADYFLDSATKNADLAEWIGPTDALERYPYLAAPYGLILAKHGFGTNMGDLCREWIGNVPVMESCSVEDWTEHAKYVSVHLSNGETVDCTRLLLATGLDLVHHPKTSHLYLHSIKGQRLQIRRPASLPPEIMPLSGFGYVVDEGDTLGIGSTFEHSWTESGPTEAGAQEILNHARTMLPDLGDPDIVTHTASIRVTVPGTRLPMIGPLPESDRVWFFTGLGSKGILMSAYLGSRIPDFFNDLEAIPAGCRVATRKDKA